MSSLSFVCLAITLLALQAAAAQSDFCVATNPCFGVVKKAAMWFILNSSPSDKQPSLPNAADFPGFGSGPISSFDVMSSCVAPASGKLRLSEGGLDMMQTMKIQIHRLNADKTAESGCFVINANVRFSPTTGDLQLANPEDPTSGSDPLEQCVAVPDECQTQAVDAKYYEV